MELFWILLGLALGLVLPRIFRALFGSEKPRSPSSQKCDRCGRLLLFGATRCDECGLVLGSPAATELADLKATHRQLERFEAREVLNPAAIATLRKQVEARRRRLSGKAPPAAPAKPVLAPSLPSSEALDQAGILTVIPAEPEAPRLPAEPMVPKVPSVKAPNATPSPATPLPREERSRTPIPQPVAPLPKPKVTPPKPPRRSVREVLAAFMEQRNIFWGELAAGLLIVGGSVALVISFWTSGALEKPFSQFLIFALINAALFGAGWYTLRYWKLESTSRGLLAIATLLVPLSFLVMGGLHGKGSGALEVTVEIASLLGFVVLVELLAARVLVPGQRWWLTAAVLGASASQLLFSWFIRAPEMDLLWVLALGAMPVACQGLSNGVALFQATRAPALEKNDAKNLFTFLGISSFALSIALGFLVYRSSAIPWAPQHLALLLALGALPLLICGIVVHRGLANALEAGALRTGATAIALLGMLLMLAAAFQAWPNSTLFLLVCAVDFAVLTVVAFRYDLPIAHAAALPCLAAGYLALLHWAIEFLLFGQIPEDGLPSELFSSAVSGIRLVGLFVVLGIAAEVIIRKGRTSHAVYYAVGGGAIACWSVLLVTLLTRGIEQPKSAMVVYATYGVCGLVMNARWRRPWLTSCALALLTGATLWGLRWRHVDLKVAGLEDAPLWGSVLALESLIMGLISAGLAWRRPRLIEATQDNPPPSVPQLQDVYREPLARSGEAISLLAILTALTAGLNSGFWELAHVVTSGCLMAVFLLLAVMERRVGMARLAGLMLIGGVVAATGWAITIREDLEFALQLPSIGLWASVAGCLMAAVALWAGAQGRPKAGPQGAGLGIAAPWYRILVAWRETAIVAVVLALIASQPSLRHSQSILPTYTGILLAVTAFLLARGYQSPSLTWVGSVFVLGSIGYALIRQYPRAEFLTPSSLALLYHATLALAASVVLKNWKEFVPSSAPPVENSAVRGSADPVQAGSALGSRVDRLFAEPLGQVGLVSSWLALPLLLSVPAGTTFSCLGLFWLAGLWLVVSIERRWPVLFTACQAVLVMAVFFGTTAWLETQTWFMDYPTPHMTRFYDPRSLQAYGIGLAAFCLVWMAARIGLQSNRRARELLDPAWMAVDRPVLAVLVLGQAVLAVLGVLPGAIHELLGASAAAEVRIWPADVVSFAYGPGAWMLLALIGIVLMAGLWEKQAFRAVVGLTIAAATIPFLAAGDYGEQLATASALRWWLALAFLECSVLVWVRGSLCRLAVKVGCKVEEGTRLPVIVRQLLVDLSAAPALVLTGLVAYLGFLGVSPAGPESGSFFERVGWVASNVVPAALISLVLAGHALRERSPAYAFASGLTADLTVMGGYALGVVVGGGSLGAVEWVRVIQLGTITAAVWAIVWLWARSWFFAERKEPESSLAQPLLTAQLALGTIGNGLLVALVLSWLAIVYPARALAAIKEAGSPLGWLTLVSATAAWALRQYQRRSLPLREAGVVGMAAVLLAACGIEGGWPGWGYRALMLGWGAYSLAWVLGAWWAGGTAKRRNGETTTESFLRWSFAVSPFPRVAVSLLDATAFWVRLAGSLAVLLALKAAFWHGDHLWAAVAIALACPAAAVMAVWRRQEAWAFAAGLGVNLSASLAVWHFHATVPLADWWVYLLQANVIASSAGTILWLAASRRIYALASAPRRALEDLNLQSTPLLAVQVALSLVGNAGLWAVALVHLALAPDHPWPMVPFGEIWGWLAWLAGAAGVYWYVREIAVRKVIHVVANFGLGLGVLAACWASRWDTHGNWLSFHVLTVAWTLFGLALLVSGWAGETAKKASARRSVSVSPFRHFAVSLLGGSPRAVLSWLEGIGILVLALAIGGAWSDPQRPYWPAGATLAVSAMSGALALWLRRPLHVYASGLLINVAGSLIWAGAGDQPWERLAYINVVSFAIGSALWTVLELWLRSRTPPVNLRGRWLPFSHLAATSGLLLMCVMIALAHMAPGIGLAALETGGFAWLVLLATILAIILCLWDPAAELACAWLYLVGLSAILLALQNAHLSPRESLWNFAVTVAPYLMMAAAIFRASPRLQKWWQAFRLPHRPDGWPQPWFIPAQLFFGIQIVALSIWMALDFSGLSERLAGPLAVGFLVPAGILMAGVQLRRSAPSEETNGPSILEYGTLVLGALAVIELGWAWLDPSHDLSWLWLHRNVIVMMALAAMTGVYGVALAGRLPAEWVWADCSRRIGPILGVLAAVTLAVILGQEAWLAGPDGVPMAPEAIAIVALAMVGLATAGLCFAVLPGKDPLGLAEQGRTMYVYAAELIVVLIFVHLRLTLPWLFQQGIFVQYWPFIMMGIAFLGVGLSEYFRQRHLRVLAEPLQWTGVFLPLLPVLAYWILPDRSQYAVLWFLVGLVYGFVSIFKGSWSFGLWGALAANIGLWVLLRQNQVSFLKHPQFWLIPIALIGLAAEHLNRDRLTQNQSTALRYMALIVIYVSSTADMFIAGLGQSWKMPLALTVLSLLGILAGMALRIRAFLYLGSTFLLLVVLTMIWYAGADLGQKWIWFASMVVLGGALLALFGLFEKRRNDILRVMDELKKWH